METIAKVLVHSIVRIDLNDENFTELRMGETINIFREETGESFSVKVRETDFPITTESKSKTPFNVGTRLCKDGIYRIEISLCEILSPITQRIQGVFDKSGSNFSEYDFFEIDLQI